MTWSADALPVDESVEWVLDKEPTEGEQQQILDWSEEPLT